MCTFVFSEFELSDGSTGGNHEIEELACDSGDKNVVENQVASDIVTKVNTGGEKWFSLIF